MLPIAPWRGWVWPKRHSSHSHLLEHVGVTASRVCIEASCHTRLSPPVTGFVNRYSAAFMPHPIQLTCAMSRSGTDAVTIDAIHEVLDRKHEEAEWGDDEMRSALMEYASSENTSMDDVSEDRSFSKQVFSKQWNKLEDIREDLRVEQESGSDLIPDPVEEARNGLEEFFDELDEMYGFGFNNRAIQMLLKRVEREEELPHPSEVERHLNQLNSGVSKDAELNFISSEYANWLENFRKQHNNSAPQRSPGSGYQIGGQADGGQAQAGGVPISQPPGQRRSPTPRGGQQQPGQQRGGPDPQVQRELDSIRDTVDSLADTVESLAESQQRDSTERVVKIEDGDTVKHVPYEIAVQNGLLGGNDGDDKDFIEKLQEAKQAGILPSREDLQPDDDNSLEETIERLRTLGIIDDGDDEAEAERFAEAMEKVSEQFSQAQAQMSQQMASAIEQLNEETDDDEELTAEKVEEIIEEKQRKNEIDQLREELKDTKEELREEVSSATRRRTGNKEPEEVQLAQIEAEKEQKQMKTAQETLQQIPEQLGELAAKMDPILDRVAEPDKSPMFNPNAAPQPQQRRQPQRGRGGQPERERRQPNEQPRREHPSQQSKETSDEMTQETAGEHDGPGTVTQEDANEALKQLGIDTDTADEGGAA